MADGITICTFISFFSFLLSISYSAPLPVFACDAQKYPTISTMGFCNTSMALPERAADLVKRMTLQEKIGFLVSGSNSVSRLGIPRYEWWSEALHGVSNVGPGTHFSDVVQAATSFPQVILTAASFNTSLFEAIGKAVSTEARAMYNLGQAGLTYWSPNVNIFRDPRWGRGQETPGEDPLLASNYAASYVRGLQGTNPNKLKVAACCKHYTAYDLDNWNGIERYRFNAIVTKQDMEDTFQPPFKSCVVDGNVASLMCSYNKVNGKPTCADPELLTGVIRGEWNFNGYIVSDCDSVDVLFNSQHYTASPEAAAAASISAGLDLNCGSFLLQYTAAAVASGLLNISAVDNAVGNNIATLMRLGFFDGDPRSHEFGELGAKDVCKKEHQELTVEAARQGIVLLKNTKGSLPFDSRIVSLAVIGPNANASKTMIGNYEGIPCKYTTPLQGLSVFAKISYHPGCGNVACGTADVDAAKTMAAAADATVIIVGTDQSIEAESRDRANILLPGQQPFLVEEVAKVSKGPVILVLMSGGGMDISFAKKNQKVTSILWVGYPGEAGGAAIAEVLFGKFNPGGRLPMTWYPQEYVEKVPMSNMNMRADPSSGYPGRSYRFYKGETVYSFGEGLSYTQFMHELVKAPPTMVFLNLGEKHKCRNSKCGSVELFDEMCDELVFDVHLRVVNVGSMKGTHTVLVFSSPPSVHNSPKKHLVGFQKVELEGGEETVMEFGVDVCKDMSVVDEDGRRKLGLGHHKFNVGTVAHSFMVFT